jgi:nucleoside phosphorylase
VGPRAATEATQAALERLRPAGLLSLGTAGALAGDWDRGDVLWVGSVSWAEGRPRQLWTGGAPGVGLVTVHAAVWDPERRSELAARGAELVDMEAAAVLDLGERRGVGRLGALKVVSDRAGAERDPVVEGQSRSRLLRLLRFKARALRLCETRLAPALVELLSA